MMKQLSFLPKADYVKRCSICGQVKPASEFYKNSHNRDGLSHRCKECKRKYVPPYRPVEQKRCRWCNEVKPAGEFYFTKKTSDRLTSICRKCHNETVNRRMLEARDARKEEFIELMGGCCQRCGYDEFQAAMDFHHVDPDEKDMSPATLMAPSFSLEDTRAELDKCVLLCSNCHRGYESGKWDCEFVRRGDGLLGYTLSLHKNGAG